MIIDEEARNAFLTPNSTKFLVSRLRDYVEKVYSSTPTNAELIEVCKMAIEIFPSLKQETSCVGGIVSCHCASMM